MEHNTKDRIGNITAPTLVLVGKEDRAMDKWRIAFYSDKRYIFSITALNIKKGVLIDEHE